MHRRSVPALLCALALLLGPGPAGLARAQGVPPHVFVVVLENLNADQAYALPYISSLCRHYGCAYDYSALAHPSGPNYLGLITGTAYPLNQDVGPSGFTAAAAAPNLGEQLTAAGIPWGAYEECMGTDPDVHATCSGGVYDMDHSPFIFVQDAASNERHLHPLSQLQSDLASSSPPDFVWIVPASLHNGDDGTPEQMDGWLSTFLPEVLSSPEFGDNGTLIITWDESSDRGLPSVTNPVPYTPVAGAGGGQVGAIVVHAGMTAGAQYDEPLDHLSLLRSLEGAYGLPLLAGARSAPVWSQLDALLRAAPGGGAPPTLLGIWWSAWGANPSVSEDGITARGVGTGEVALWLWGTAGHLSGALATAPLPGSTAAGWTATGPVSGISSVSAIVLSECGVGGPWTEAGAAQGGYAGGCASVTLEPDGALAQGQAGG